MGNQKNDGKIGVSLGAEMLARCDAAMEKTNATSRSEFIRDALEHYIAVLNMKENSRVLTPALESVIGGKIAGTEERISRMIYKLAVEISMLNHLYAGYFNTNREQLNWLREHCKQEVATINGRMNLADIAEEYEG